MPNFDDIDLTDVIMDGDPYGNFEDPGGGYNLVQSSDKSETTLTEDGVDKTTLPLVSTFVGTRAEWNALSVTERAAYRILELKEEGTFERNPTTGNLTIVSSNNTDTEILNLVNPIGTIIHSTTCDTMAKVVAAYGGTTWIQHTGYVLRAASSGVTANSAAKDGGEDTHKLTANEIPAHTHGSKSLTGTFGATDSQFHWNWGGSGIISAQYRNSGYMIQRVANGSGSQPYQITVNATHEHNSVGGGAAHNNMQSYKNVYIWERTS